MNKQQKAQTQLDFIFVSNKTTTPQELRTALLTSYPEEDWTQQWVSSFMIAQNLTWENSLNFRTRIYHRPEVLTVEILEDFCNDLVTLGEAITKTNLKTLVRGNNLPLTNFGELFNQLNLQPNGKYTADNHKIWVKVPVGKHLSKSKNTLVNIKDMPKKYLLNAICKYVHDNGQPDMHSMLTDTSRELHKLLQAYFTYEIRNSI